MSSSLSSRLQSIFSEREEEFIQTLKSILSSISSDQYIQQMFDNKLSANYIPDRVCELIRLFLHNDQEIFIEKLLKRIKSLEACFGKTRILKLEEIGNKMMEVSMSQAQKEAEYRRILQMLNSNMKDEAENIDNDYSYNESVNGDKDDLKNLKEITSSLSNSTGILSNIIRSYQSSLQKDFKKMRSQSRKFVNRLNLSAESVSELKSDNSKLLKQIEQLNNRIKEMKDKNKEQANKESQIKSELDKIKRKYQNQIQKQEESLKASKDLEENMKDKYENQINQMKNEMNNMTEKVNRKMKQLQEKNKQLKQELENSMKQNSTIDGDVNSLQQKVSQLQNSNRLLQMEVASKQDSIEKYKNGRAKESQEFQKYITRLTDQNKKNEDDLFKKDKQIRQIQSEKDSLQNELNLARKKVLDYEKQLTNKQKELNAYLVDKEKQSEDAKEMKNSFSEIIQNKDQEIARKQEKIENNRKEKQQLLSQYSNLQNSISQLQEQLRRKESEIEQQQNVINSLQIENGRLSARQSKLKNGVSQYHEQVGQKDSEIQLLQNKIRSLKERNSELENSLQSFDQTSIQNQNQLDSKQREIGELKNQFQKLQSTINKLQDQVRKKDSELIEKQQTIDSFENENNEQTDLNTQLQDTLLQTKDKLRQKEKEIMNLKRTIDEYQRENLKEQVAQIPIIEKAKEEAIKRGDNLAKQNQEMKGKISELQLAVHEARQQLNHIKAITQAGPNKEDLTRQIQNYMKENSDLKIQNAHLQNQIQMYKEEADSLKRSFESTNSQNKEKEKSIRQIKEKYNYSQQKMNESQVKIEEMTEKCSEYETSLKMLAKKYQQKEKQISLHKKDKNEMRKKLQNAEEENQKLNISLSNVNDQLHNLKSEIQQKNDQIHQLKNATENQVSIQRELTSVQRSLNEKTSLLNDSESRNSSLMKEIEEKEAKICKLSDSLLDKDRELKTIQQTQMSTKRQNETLTSLTKEQQRKLEEAHQEALQLHEELLKVQNEALYQSESMKAISIDQSREAEGRKQIQQIINQDREKYRNRINQLQEENTSLSVSKVDLQHKFDQLSFENKTLSQLLEAKENELSFEKERGAQDMQNATNVTNKIIEENKQLKQQLTDKNSYDKELLNQIREYYNNIQNLDEIPELIQQMVQTSDELKSICDKLKISEPFEIQSELSKLIKKNEELSNRDERIYSLFPDNNRDELPELISNMKHEFNELQDLKTKLNQITNSNNIQKTVQTCITSLKAFQKRESELAKIVPDYSFDRLASDVSQLIHNNQDNTKIIQQICSVLGVSFPNNLPDFVSGINKRLDNYQNTENQIKQIVLINNLNDIIPHLQKFVKQNDQLSLEHKQISSLLSSNSDSDDLPSKVASLIHENNANKEIFKSLINCLPDNSSINKGKFMNSSKLQRKSQKNLFNNDNSEYDDGINNEIVGIVSQIVHENDELKQQQKNLIETHLNPALKKNKELLNERAQIASSLNCNESDNLPQKALEVAKENESIKKQLRKVESILPHSFKGNDVTSQIENTLGALNDLQNERKEIKEIISKDDDFNDNQKNKDDIISNLHNLLQKKAEYSRQLDDINSVVSSTKDNKKSKNKLKDRDEITGKVKELLKNKEKLEQTLNEITSTLPDSKSDIQETLQNLIQRNAEQENLIDAIESVLPSNSKKSYDQKDLPQKIHQEIERKRELEEQLSVLQRNLAKFSGNECKTFDDVLNSISEIQNENDEMKDAFKSINEILRNQKSANNNNSNNNKKKTQKSKQQKKNQNGNTEIDDFSPLISQIKDNSITLDKIDELFDQSDDLNLLDRIKKEIERSNEDLQTLTSIQSMIPDSNSFSDLHEKLNEILNEKETAKNVIQQASSILPPVDSKKKAKSKPKNNRNNNNNLDDNISNLINQAEHAVEEIESMKNLINEIESTLPSSQTKSDILSRLKDELDDKENIQRQLEILHSIIPNSDDLNDLPQQLQNTIKQNEDLKICIGEAHQILNSDDEESEQRKSSQWKKKNNNNRNDEIEPDQLLLELTQFKKEKEELKNQLSELDSLLLQHEQQQQASGNSKSKSKQFSRLSSKQDDDESLFNRVKRQLENQQQSTENLEKVAKQLFGQSATYQPDETSSSSRYKKSINDQDYGEENSRNIDDIQSQINSLQSEHEILQQLFLQELEKTEENSSNRPKSSQQNRKQKQLKQLKSKGQKANNDENDLNVVDMANQIISAKNISDDTLAEINSLLPEKMNPNETLLMRLKREMKSKDALQDQLNEIQSMFPDSNSPEELNSLISSLQEAHNLSKDEQAELSLILQEEGEEGSINTVQKILNEKKQLETKLNQIESLLPSTSTSKGKSYSKAPKNEDVVERLKNELNKENEMKMILEQLCRILPRCSTKDKIIPQTEKIMKLLSTLISLLDQNRSQNELDLEFEEEEEIDDENETRKDFNDEKLINDIKSMINKNKQQNSLLNDIESMLPVNKSKPKKELNLLERIQKELNKKKDLEEKQQRLQKQISELSGNEIKSFDDISSSISQLQNKNLEMQGTLESIGTIFSTKATDNGSKKKQSIDQDQLVQKVDSYVDASENDRKLLSEIESLLPPSHNKDDLSTRIKNELNKKNEVQQLTGNLQSMIPGVKTPEQLSSKIKELLNENANLKNQLELLNQILSTNKQNNDTENEEEKSSLVDHLLPQQKIEKIRKRSNLDDENESDDEYHKKITSRAKLVVDQNAIYQEFANDVVSLLPSSSEPEITKKTKKNKKVPSNDENDDDVLTRLKNELKIKEKVIKQLDKLSSLLSVSFNDSLSSLFDDSFSSKINEMLNEKESMKQKLKVLDSIVPKNQENQNKNDEEDEDENENDDNLIPRCQSLVQAKEQQDSLLNEMNSLLQKSSTKVSPLVKKSKGKGKSKNTKNSENEDIIQKLKNELNDKEQLIQLLDSLKSMTDENNDENQMIDHFKSLFDKNNELNHLLNEICNLLNINDNENDDESNNDRKESILTKIKELINERNELQKSIDEIQSLLPKSKTKESLVSRIQKELKKKDNSIKQLETVQSLLPSSTDDIFGQMQTVLKESSELKEIIIEMIKLLSSEKQKEDEEDENDNDDENDDESLLNNNKENVIPRMKTIINERNNLKQQIDQILPLLTSQPSSKSSSSSPAEMLKNELKNGRNALKKLNGLLSLIPDSNDPENLSNSIQEMIHDNENMKKILESLQGIIPSLEAINNDSFKLKDIIPITTTENKNDENEEEEEDENKDLIQRAKTIVYLFNEMKKSIDEFDSLLPNSQSKEKSASQSPASQKSKKSMNQQKKKKNELIIDRLKNELNEKSKLIDQMDKINGLMANSDSNNLTNSLQDILHNNNKLKSLFKDSLDVIKKNKEKGNDDDEEEEDDENVDSEKFLSELKQLMNESDKMNKELQSIDELVNQQEQPKLKPKSFTKSKVNQKAPPKPEKKPEDLKARIENQFDKKKQNRENLDKIVKQLFGDSLSYNDDNDKDEEDNSRNIENILSHIKTLQDEHNSLFDLLNQEIKNEKQDKSIEDIEIEEEEEDAENSNQLIDLANKLISLNQTKGQILTQINSIVPTQFDAKENKGKSKPKHKQQQPNKESKNQQDLTPRIEKLVSQYKQMSLDFDKINSILPKSESDEDKDIASRIEEILHSNEDLTAQMEDLHSLFPLTKSQEEFKLSVTGMMKEKESLAQLKTEIDNLLSEQFPETPSVEEEKEIPSKLRRLLKEKEELSVLLGVNEDHKSAVEILIDQKSNLKKEYDTMYGILSQLRSVLNCNSNDELVQLVTDQKAALKSSSELFVKMLETLIGPLNISSPIQLPISSQMKDKLFSILSQMKKQNDETAEKIMQILNKAKRSGYNGNDFYEAVTFLEETATLYEQQRVDEKYLGQVSNIRELMSEQGKKFDDAKKQYQSVNKERQEKLNELQEKFILREKEIISENEENKKKIIELKDELEKSNKTKSELLRFACGHTSDLDILKSNLTRSEYMMLKNAEKNRKIILQEEEKAESGKK